MDLDFVCIECDIITPISAQLIAPLYKALRNIEREFRVLCCQKPSEPCDCCALHIKCPYRITFSQQLSSDPEVVRSHQKPSLPFSLYVRKGEYAVSSNTITTGLVIIGNAVNYMGLFHAALIKIIKTAVASSLPFAEFRLATFCLDYQGMRHEIKNDNGTEGITLLSGQYIFQNAIYSDSVKLSLLSPLCLLQNGSIAHNFEFPLFFRSQLRRCSSLCAYYGKEEWDLDFRAFAEAAESVTLLENETEYNRLAHLKGLTGTVECYGLVEPMFSFLLLGSYFNAGKGATYGAGFYHILAL